PRSTGSLRSAGPHRHGTFPRPSSRRARRITVSSSLPPAPGSRPPTLGATLEELADRLGTSVRAVLAGGVLAVLALAGVALLWFRDEPAAPELSMPYAAGVEVTSDATVPSTTAQTVPGEVTIHVAGAVRNPGVYVVP